MRLFVALEIPHETRDALGKLIARLAPTCRGARWLRTESMHLTLKFIGEIPGDTVARIQEQLAAVRARSAIPVAFRDVGFFPTPRHPRVFWAGIEAGPALAEMAAQIELNLEPLGIARETRAFRPHLTLARFNSASGLPALHSALEKLQNDAGASLDFGSATYESFHLMESKLHRSGAVYSTVATYRFTGPASASPEGAHE